MNPSQFVAKWRRAKLTEHSASHEHFLDLCDLFDHPHPADADPTGVSFTFEKGASKHAGGEGWADVWKKGFFAIEYKGKHKDLDAAYDQLLQYREALENPPLLVTCDMDRIVIRTNFTATPTQLYDISLDRLGEPRNLEILRASFYDPARLKPGATSEAITADAASHLARIAETLRSRGANPHDVAHFLDRIVFCLFAEDIGLLPEDLFTRIVEKSRDDPARFSKLLSQLFNAMAHGGDFGADTIRHFNGNLFTEGPVLDLAPDEIQSIRAASNLDWSAVDPSIFGTLFERGMDPAKRAQLGAHYTSRADIETLVEPVVMSPLRREWQETKTLVENLLATGKKHPPAPSLSASSPPPPETRNPKPETQSPPRLSPSALKKAVNESGILIHSFLTRLSKVRVLDPACGSGNFLYVTLQKLKDLEKEVITYAGTRIGRSYLPLVAPWQLYGIEISTYAFELAQMTLWIGYLQWTRANGFPIEQDPILKPGKNFFLMDAILDLSDPDHPKEPDWPSVDFIVGNPPFLGDKFMRGELGDDYVEALRSLYDGRVPGGADLCCYWFEQARAQIKAGKCKRAGLLATQGIRGGANRRILERIKKTGDIFFAQSDRPWILEGANVHVSMVGFDDGDAKVRILDGEPVPAIHPNLSALADITSAAPLKENTSLSFLGSCKGGPFDIDEQEALALLTAGGNPNRLPNSDVLRPVLNSQDLLKGRGGRWIIDDANLDLSEACLYEAPHVIVLSRVKPARDKNRNSWLRENWWRPQRMRPLMREKAFPLERFIVTPTTSKHRVFVWITPPVLPDHQLIVFARSDDYFFGVLHSRVHEVWARAQGTQLRERESGFRYTPTTCFETFPFPDPTDAQRDAIALAAKEVNDLRENWLNPPEWTATEILEFPGSSSGPWSRFLHDPDSRGIGTVRYPRLVPRDPACASKLKPRTLTNLYNQRLTWLSLAHAKLDSAVFSAYGWESELADEAVLEKLLALNLERSRKE